MQPNKMMQKVARGHCFAGKKQYRTVKSLENSEKQVFFTKINFFYFFLALLCPRLADTADRGAVHG